MRLGALRTGGAAVGLCFSSVNRYPPSAVLADFMPDSQIILINFSCMNPTAITLRAAARCASRRKNFMKLFLDF
jgi:hypothetical protein